MNTSDTKDDTVLFRTLMRKDVFERFRQQASNYSTAYGKFDYGVFIQILLDFYENHTTITQVNLKLDAIAQMIHDGSEDAQAVEQDLKQEKEPEHIEMLGGEKIYK